MSDRCYVCFGFTTSDKSGTAGLGDGYVRCRCNFAYVRRGDCDGEKGRQGNFQYANPEFVESSGFGLRPPYRKGDGRAFHSPKTRQTLATVAARWRTACANRQGKGSRIVKTV